jgi:hypothetical protein
MTTYSELVKKFRAKNSKPETSWRYESWADSARDAQLAARDFYQGGRVQYKPGGLVEPGVSQLVQPNLDGSRPGYAGITGMIKGPEKTSIVKLNKLKDLVAKENTLYRKAVKGDLLIEAGWPNAWNSIDSYSPVQGEIKKIFADLTPTVQKMENYVKNVMFAEDALVKDFKSPMIHLAKKFNVSSSFIETKFVPYSKAYKENKKVFSSLGKKLSWNKFSQMRPDGTFMTIQELSTNQLNKPIKAGLHAKPNAGNIIMNSAYRNYVAAKEMGTIPKVTFIGDPMLQDPKDWKFEHKGKVYGYDVGPGTEIVDMPGDNRFHGRKVHSLNLTQDAGKKLHGNVFPDVYKAVDDYDEFMKKTVINPQNGKEISLDRLTRQANYNATGKKTFLLRSSVDFDHFDQLDEPFDNIRILDRRVNQAAGVIKAHYKNDPKRLAQLLDGIGYNKQYKNVADFADNLTVKSQIIMDPKNFTKKGGKLVYTGPKVSTPFQEFKIFEEKLADIKGTKKLKLPVSGGTALHSFPANIPGMWKKLGATTRKGLGWFGADILFYELDWRNEMSKGKNEKEAKASALNNATIGLYKNKTYIEELKKVAKDMGIDSRAFDQVYDLNKMGSKIQNQKEAYKNRIAKLEAMEATNPAAKEKKAKILEEIKLASANFDKDADKMMSKGIEKAAGQVSISKAAEVFPTPNLDQIAKARGEITQTDFAKPFAHLQMSAYEKLRKEKEAAYDMQSKQVHPEAGNIGDWLLRKIFTLDYKGKKEEQKRIKDMLAFDPKELYRYNKARGLDPDAPVTLEAYQNLASDPGLAFNTGGRVAFGGGGIDKGRRAFMKWLAGITGAGVAAGTGLLKWGKVTGKGKTIVKAGDHIIQGTPGMPDWYIPLINRVTSEGKNVTGKLGTVEREIVHTKKIGKGEEVTVYQDMNTGNVRIEYGPTHPRASNDLSTVHLEYRAPVEDVTAKGKPFKTKSEFEAVESEPKYVATSPDDAEVVWDLDNVVGNVDDLTTDTSKLKEFATKKKLTHRDKVKAKKKQEYRQKLEEDTSTQVDYSASKYGEGDYDDYLPDIDDLD